MLCIIFLIFYWEDFAMVVKKKSSRKVVKKKKVLKLKKGKKRAVKRKGAKVSKPIPYEIIKVAKLPDEVLKKIKDGDKEWRSDGSSISKLRYHSTMGRFRRWFDWLNNSFKILTEVKAIDYNMVAQIKERIPKEYHYHIEALTDSHNRIRGQLYEVEHNVHNVMRSIYYYHGKDLNIELEDGHFPIPE